MKICPQRLVGGFFVLLQNGDDEADGEVAPHVADATFACQRVGADVLQAA